MKNRLLWITLAGFCIASCKKTYTCECNTTITYLYKSQFYTEVIPGSKETYDQKLREKQAKAACQHEETATQTNMTNWLTANGQYTLVKGESITTSCGLK